MISRPTSDELLNKWDHLPPPEDEVGGPILRSSRKDSLMKPPDLRKIEHKDQYDNKDILRATIDQPSVSVRS